MRLKFSISYRIFGKDLLRGLTVSLRPGLEKCCHERGPWTNFEQGSAVVSFGSYVRDRTGLWINGIYPRLTRKTIVTVLMLDDERVNWAEAEERTG